MAKVAAGVAGRSILLGRGESRVHVYDSDKISEPLSRVDSADWMRRNSPSLESRRTKAANYFPIDREHSYAIFAKIPVDRRNNFLEIAANRSWFSITANLTKTFR